MSAIKLDKFGGMLPAWDDHLLPDGQSALCRDAYLMSGALIGWRAPKLLRALADPVNTKFVYRVPFITGAHDQANLAIDASDSIWLEFADRFTDVMRSPVVNDSFRRYYFASPSAVPKYNTYARIANGDPPWLLGVPAPGCVPGVTVEGGGDTAELGFPTSSSATVATPGANTMAFVKILPIGAMALNSVNFTPETTSIPAKFQAALYTHDAGTDRPLERVAVSQIETGCTADTSIVLTFLNPPPVVANQTYWVCVACDTAIGFLRANAAGATGVIVSNPFVNGPPQTITVSTPAQPEWQIGATLSIGSVLAARSYVYTWVTEYGEEGPPSLPTVVDGWSNGVWTIDLFQPAAADMGTDRSITKKRLYRTVSNAEATSYFYVTELDVGTNVYSDIVGDDLISLNGQLESSLWFGPPTDLQGIAALPNGIAVGFRANEVWFSESYRPHAWPPSFVLACEFPIVGIGIVGQAVVICTQGIPYVANGVNPASMALSKVQMPEPCISRRSIVPTDGGVLYISPNGMINVTPAGSAVNITELWITRERWRELTPSKFVHAIKLASSFFAFGVVDGVDVSVAKQGFTLELSPSDQQSFSIWPQPGGHRLGFNELTSPNGFNIDNLLVDPWTGIGLVIQNGSVYYYDFSDQAPTIVPYLWRSKKFQENAKRNYEAMRVFFSVPPGTPAQSATRNTALVQTLASNQYAIVRVYADGVLVTTREVRSSGELLRIVAGFKAEVWQWEIEGRVLIFNMQVATSVKELSKL